jgi:catechol 2,3-dioxygenase-like lactoylglutathione lyase family enzyme
VAALRVSCVTFDCHDPEALVAFWAAALGYEGAGHTCRPPDGIGPYLEFVVVPEPKAAKNRVHLGFNTPDLDAEIGRLVALGATLAWEEEFPPDVPYRNVVLRDPEGNEFCLGTAVSTAVRAVADAAEAASAAGDVEGMRRVAASLRSLAGG